MISIRHSTQRYCTGFILLPVVIAITLLAAIALLVSRDSGMAINAANSEMEAQRAEYVAQAGLQHALHDAAQQGCGPYANLTNVAFDNDQYTTSLTTDFATATQYTINVDQDTWIRSDFPTNNYASDWKMHTRFESGIVERPLLRFDLSPIPANAPILSARLRLYIVKQHPEGPIDIHRITRDWQSATATWDNMNDKIDPEIIASIPAQGSKFVHVYVNLTSQVQAWVNGQVNHGITLNSTREGVHAEYSTSNDFGNYRPIIEVQVGAPPTPIASLKSVGKLANGVTRSITRDNLSLMAKTQMFKALQPGNSDGKDSFFLQGDPNFGSSTFLRLGTRFNGFAEQSWLALQFDAGRIPSSATIQSAQLELYQSSNPNGTSGEAEVYRITRDWSELDIDWTRRTASANWINPGGDYAPGVMGQTLLDTANGWYSWDISELVTGWVSRRYPNYGLLVRSDEANLEYRDFVSSEHSSSQYHPRLTIQYSCECGVTCVSPQGNGTLLMVVLNPTTLVPLDAYKKSLFESWGYTVTVVGESANQATYDTALAGANAVFISESVNAMQVGSKLDGVSHGVVSQDGIYNDDLGIATGYATVVSDSVNLVDTSHYITQLFAPGALTIYRETMEQQTVSGTSSTDLVSLGLTNAAGSLVVLEPGAAMVGGGTLAGRRVMLPLGRDTNMNWNYLNSNGELLLQRAIAWAMGADADPTNLLFVSGGPTVVVYPSGDLVPLPTAQEQLRIDLMESWGFQVNLISDSDTPANFDSAIASNVVAYVPQDITSSNLGTKLTDATIGVVNEEGELVDELGFSGDKIFKNRSQIDILDNTHYITQPFATGLLTFVSPDQSVHMLKSSLAPGLTTLAQSFNVGSQWEPSLATIETGGALSGSGNAAGRRVQLPWGGGTFDIDQLTPDGQTIMQRALEWALQDAGALGPIAHWQLDEGAGNTAVDIAGGHNGSITTPAWSEGAIGGGLQVTAVDNALIVPHDDNLSLSDKLTLMAWVNNQSLSGYDTAIAKATSGADLNYFLGTLEDEVVFGFSTSNGWKSQVTAGANLQTGTWYHIAASFDNANDRIKIYLDGIMLGNFGLSHDPFTNSGNVMLGRSAIGELLDGRMDDARIYDRVLSDAEIAEAATLPPPTPLAHWKLDETSGINAEDSAGSHDGILINDPAWDTGGSIDGALLFDGSSEYVDVAHQNTLSLDTHSISAWIHPDTLSGWQIIVNKGTTTTAINYYLATDGDEVSLGFYNGGWEEFTTNGVNLVTGQWYHVVATFDNATREGKIYVDNTLVLTDSVTKNPLANSDNLTIGRSAFGEYWQGKLDDIRLYNRVLEADDVNDLFGGGAGSGSGGPPVFEEFTDARLGSNGKSLTISKPTGTVEGSLLVAAVNTDGNNTSSLSPPSGWNEIDIRQHDGRITLGVWWKIATASESAVYTFNWSNSEHAYGAIMRFSGHDPATPIADQAHDTGKSDAPNSPAVTTTLDNSLVLRIGAFDDDDIIAVGDPGLSGHTAINMDESSGGNHSTSGGSGYLLQPTAGNSGTSAFALSGSEEWVTTTIAISPVP